MNDQKSIQDELRKIKAAIQAQKALRGQDILPEDDIEATLLALQEKRQSLLARLEGSAPPTQIETDGGALVKRDVDTKGGPFIGRDHIRFDGDVYLGPQTRDPAEALAVYRTVVRQTTASLPLRGVDVGASDPTAAQKPLGLANIYVALDTTDQVEIREAKKYAAERSALPEGHESRPLPAGEAVLNNRQLVLLGDPGGGKTTFVRFLAHCLSAHSLEPEAGWLRHLPGWPREEASLLPILVTLRDFALQEAQSDPSGAAPRHLWDFIHERLGAQNLEFTADPLRDCLEGGKAFVLLDGLDEIASQHGREFVVAAVRAFMARYPHNRYLITCRVLSYLAPESSQEPDLRLTELPDFTLAQLSEDKIDRFIQAWYAELARLGTVLGGDADLLANRLQDTVRRPDLWRLAPNPLLLTVIALVHTHRGRLPEARALLYEETVDILLWRWEQVKLGGQEDAPLLRQLLLDAGRSEVDLKRVLWELAYEAQSRVQPGEETELADISELRLQKALASLSEGDHNWARRVVSAIKLRAGLLIERSPEVFTFPHRTFQEYLAGAHLAVETNFAANAAALADQGAQWREVILLAVGKLVYLSGEMDKPLALVGELCPSQLGDNEQAWRRTWLAGNVLVEMGSNRVRDSALGRDLLTRVGSRLVNLLEQEQLGLTERTRAGDILAQLGDPRFDPTAWYLPAESLLGFVHIPAGPFIMGSNPQLDVEAFDDERPEHEVLLPDFFVSRYPVTVAQFRSFVGSSGYQPRDPDSLLGLANHPVVRITWYKAINYCQWLSEKLRAWEDTPEPLASLLRQDGWQLSLPSEAEWEKAARGGIDIPGKQSMQVTSTRLARFREVDHLFPNPNPIRLYPWGEGSDPEKANFNATGIGVTSSVGCFPAGVSPYGMHELCGNVWEWTRNLWSKDWEEPYFKYPYIYNDSRENVSAEPAILRVIRGGAFDSYSRNVRCAHRNRRNPNSMKDNIGFRIVVSQLDLGH